MKKCFASLVLSLVAMLTGAEAMGQCCFTKRLGIFNHLGVGVGVGSTGISAELATPITRFVALRAGLHFMPGITFNTDVDASYDPVAAGIPGANPGLQYTTVDVEGDLGRSPQGSVIFNVYPFPSGSFFIAAGAFFGSDKLLKIKGHSDDLAGLNGSIEVGDYNIPIDKDGNVRGGLKVKGFRPYLGLGWGRAIPRRLLNFNVELGAQFQGKPQVYSETGDLEDLANKSEENDFHDVIKYLKVYPTLTFRLTGKIF